MKEDILHFVWKTKRIKLNNLQTTDKRPLKILHFGTHNHNAGPDFFGCTYKN